MDTDLFSKQCAAEIQSFDIATHDAWIVQCSKGTDISALVNKRIKMPGRRYVGDYQVRTTTYAEPLDQSVGYVNAKGKYALRRLPLTGHIVVSKRLNMRKPEDNPDENLSDDVANSFPEVAGPQKLKLAVRHPFFGRDYKNRIELNKKTARELRKADEKSAQATARQRVKGNYYTIRSKLLANTQTLKQKEHDVRQSVLTGIAPKFMENSTHPDYVDLTLNGDQASDTEVEPPVKQKKRKANGNASITASFSEEPVVVHLLDDNDDVEPTPKKIKKHKKNGEVQAEETMTTTPAKSHKKHKAK